MKLKLLSVVILVTLLVTIACTPYQPMYQQQGYVTPIYEPSLNIVYVGGVRGYYDPFNVFRPMIVVGGYSGYYNSGGSFVSNAPEIRSHVQSGKPFYAGPSSTSRGPSTQGYYSPQQRTPQSDTTPSYRSPSQRPSDSFQYQQQKPNYGGGGSMTRSAPRITTPAPASSYQSSKPNYGGGGSMTRSSSPSSGGGMSRGPR